MVEGVRGKRGPRGLKRSLKESSSPLRTNHRGLKSLCEYLQSTGEIGDKEVCRDF
jgi:hypothetical protein